MNELAIVIPAYKDKFLSKVLKDLSKQTNKNFNVYIGDDNSPYPIRVTVDKYKTNLPITYVKFNTNLGGNNLVLQWERCIQLVQNEKWIWLFSDDDELDDDCVDAFYNYQKLHPTLHIFHFDVNIINEKSEIIKRCTPYPSQLSATEFYKMKMEGSIQSFVVENIFSIYIYNQIKGFEKFDLAWGSDTATWVKMIGDTKLHTIPTATVRWRESTENITPNFSEDIMMRKAKALISFFSWSNYYFHNTNITKSNISYFIKRMRLYSKHIKLNIILKIADDFNSQKVYSAWEICIIKCKIITYHLSYGFILKRFK